MRPLPARPRCIDQPDGVARDLFGDDDLPHELLNLENLGAAQHPLRRLRRHACRLGDDSDLFVLVEVGHDDVEHEAVELRLGERIGSFELDGILRREHEERPLERIGPARGRDVILLHRLEESRLRLRRRAVDLVGEEDLREDRPADEAQRAVPAVLVENLSAGNVSRHQVGRELDPLERQVEDLRDGLDQKRLGQTRYACDQAVAAGKERDEDLIDHRILSDDDLADLGEDALPAARDALGNSGNIAGGCGRSVRRLTDRGRRVHQFISASASRRFR